MWKEKEPLKSIARKCDVAYNTVKSAIKRYQLTGGVKDLPRKGGKIKTSPREDRWILRQCKINRRATSSEIKIGLEKLSGCKISASSVRRLIKAKMYCRRAVKKPFLSRFQRLRRFRWAKAHAAWQQKAWRKVIFSDESKFVVWWKIFVCQEAGT